MVEAELKAQSVPGRDALFLPYVLGWPVAKGGVRSWPNEPVGAALSQPRRYTFALLNRSQLQLCSSSPTN